MKRCPLLNKPCIGMECEFYIHILGADPQTGKELDQWGCTVAFLPKLLIENAKINRETGAAVESLRNTQVRNAGALAALMAGVNNNLPQLPQVETKP